MHMQLRSWWNGLGRYLLVLLTCPAPVLVRMIDLSDISLCPGGITSRHFDAQPFPVPQFQRCERSERSGYRKSACSSRCDIHAFKYCEPLLQRQCLHDGHQALAHATRVRRGRGGAELCEVVWDVAWIPYPTWAINGWSSPADSLWISDHAQLSFWSSHCH